MSISYYVSLGGLGFGPMDPSYDSGIGNEAINLFLIPKISTPACDIDLYDRTVFEGERLGVLLLRLKETSECIASSPDDLGFDSQRLGFYYDPSCSIPGYITLHPTPKSAAIYELNNILFFTKVAIGHDAALVFSGD